MNEEMFAVYDSAVKRFAQPFFAPTIESACRMFRQVVSKADHPIAKFPQDYTLFHVGTWDALRGCPVSLETPHSLGVALTFVESSAPQLVKEA